MKKYLLIAITLVTSIILSSNNIIARIQIISTYDSRAEVNIIIGCPRAGYCEYILMNLGNNTISEPKDVTKLFTGLNLKPNEIITSAWIGGKVSEPTYYLIASDGTNLRKWSFQYTDNSNAKKTIPVTLYTGALGNNITKFAGQGSTSFLLSDIFVNWGAYAYLGKQYVAGNNEIANIATSMPALNNFKEGAEDITAAIALDKDDEGDLLYVFKNDEVMRLHARDFTQAGSKTSIQEFIKTHFNRNNVKTLDDLFTTHSPFVVYKELNAEQDRNIGMYLDTMSQARQLCLDLMQLDNKINQCYKLQFQISQISEYDGKLDKLLGRKINLSREKTVEIGTGIVYKVIQNGTNGEIYIAIAQFPQTGIGVKQGPFRLQIVDPYKPSQDVQFISINNPHNDLIQGINIAAKAVANPALELFYNKSLRISDVTKIYSITSGMWYAPHLELYSYQGLGYDANNHQRYLETIEIPLSALGGYKDTPNLLDGRGFKVNRRNGDSSTHTSIYDYKIIRDDSINCGDKKDCNVRIKYFMSSNKSFSLAEIESLELEKNQNTENYKYYYDYGGSLLSLEFGDRLPIFNKGGCQSGIYCSKTDWKTKPPHETNLCSQPVSATYFVGCEEIVLSLSQIGFTKSTINELKGATLAELNSKDYIDQSENSVYGTEFNNLTYNYLNVYDYEELPGGFAKLWLVAYSDNNFNMSKYNYTHKEKAIAGHVEYSYRLLTKK